MKTLVNEIHDFFSAYEMTSLDPENKGFHTLYFSTDDIQIYLQARHEQKSSNISMKEFFPEVLRQQREPSEDSRKKTENYDIKALYEAFKRITIDEERRTFFVFCTNRGIDEIALQEMFDEASREEFINDYMFTESQQINCFSFKKSFLEQLRQRYLNVPDEEIAVFESFVQKFRIIKTFPETLIDSTFQHYYDSHPVLDELLSLQAGFQISWKLFWNAFKQSMLEWYSELHITILNRQKVFNFFIGQYIEN